MSLNAHVLGFALGSATSRVALKELALVDFRPRGTLVPIITAHSVDLSQPTNGSPQARGEAASSWRRLLGGSMFPLFRPFSNCSAFVPTSEK